MKQIQQYIQESILDDEDDIIQNDDLIIDKWLRDNYSFKKGLDSYVLKNKVIDINSDIYVKNKKITQLLPPGYTFGVIKGEFNCSSCQNLISLEGAPHEVGESFICAYCNKIKDLQGAPQIAHYCFDCSYCKNLKTLKGAPQKVAWHFKCDYCQNLESLIGAPQKVGGSFLCSNCPKLKNLNGIPKYINGHFIISNTDNNFTEEQIRKLSKIGHDVRFK